MPAKRFLVKVELVVQKISCPGVWLCSNGKISLQLGMLDSTIQTESYRPVFPVLFQEKFIFYKTFLKERRLNELQRSLGREWLCAELIQWKNCDEGVVLATFQTTLDDLLYPSAFKSSNLAGTDVDLLMEPTKLFPGTISPKLELRTKTTIEETFCDLEQRYSDRILHGNPVKNSCSSRSPSKKLHPKRVCHTIGYSKAQQRYAPTKKDKRPIFKYRKAEDDLILRLNPDKVVKDDIVVVSDDLECAGDENSNFNRRKGNVVDVHWCYCEKSKPLATQETTSSSFVKSVKSNSRKQAQSCSEKCSCACTSQHEPHLCPICSKYECTFATTSSSRSIREFLSESTNRNSGLKFCSYCRLNFAKNKSKLRCSCEAPEENKKVCFCMPNGRTSSLAQRLHERLKSTVQNGASRIEDCFRECDVCE